MISSIRQESFHAGPVDPLERWLTQHAIVMLGAIALAAAVRSGLWLAVAGAFSFTLLLRRIGGPARRIRPADVMTVTRLAVLVIVAAALPALDPGWALAAFVFNVVVDAVDGRVARMRGETTRLGAVLDRETDGFFVLIAYVYLHWEAGIGMWVLFFGALPYLYRLWVVASAADMAPEHKEKLAARLAAANFVLLLAAVAFPAYATLIVVVSALVLSVSFGGSLWNLARHAYSRRQ